MNNTNFAFVQYVRDSDKRTYTHQEVVDLFHLMADEQENLIYDFLEWIARHGYIIEHSMGKWYYDNERIDPLDLFYKFQRQVRLKKEGGIK